MQDNDCSLSGSAARNRRTSLPNSPGKQMASRAFLRDDYRESCEPPELDDNGDPQSTTRAAEGAGREIDLFWGSIRLSRHVRPGAWTMTKWLDQALITPREQ